MSERPTNDRREFLRNAGLFAVTVAIPSTVWGCSRSGSEEKDGTKSSNAEWAKRVAELEKAGIYTKEVPGKWEGKAKSHVPQVTLNIGEGTIELFTDHGMSPSHWITTHYLRNQDGKIIALQEYQGTDPEARHTFTIPEGTTMITAFSYCNKHDDWSADQVKAT